MSFVRIEQRNARLAQAVKLDQIKGREGFITKGTVVVLSNVRKGEGRDDEVTSILWTLWGKQADNAAEYLGKVMGRITLAGALFLALITVVLPLLTSILTGVPSTSLYLGGTAILIVVGVALDTMKQIETQLLMRQYKGFIK